MTDEKQMTIHFVNGTQMQVAFPTQIKGSLGALAEASKTILQSDKLVIQTEQQLLIVPWSSVNHLEVSGVPATALPFGAIKGAKVVSR